MSITSRSHDYKNRNRINRKKKIVTIEFVYDNKLIQYRRTEQNITVSN